MIIGLVFFLAAVSMKRMGVPAWWPVLAAIGGGCSLGLAGLSLIAGLLIDRPLPEDAERDKSSTDCE